MTDRPEPLADSLVAAWTLRASRGDAEALGFLFDALFDHVLRVTSSITRRDEAFCLDVVQEAFVRAARSIPPLPDRRALDAWFARTIRTTAIDLLRREQRRRRHEESSASQREYVVEPECEGVDHAELIAWIENELDQLPLADRQLISGRVLDGSSFRDLASRAGTSVHAVSGRIRRTLDVLRRKARRMFGDVL